MGCQVEHHMPRTLFSSCQKLTSSNTTDSLFFPNRLPNFFLTFESGGFREDQERRQQHYKNRYRSSARVAPWKAWPNELEKIIQTSLGRTAWQDCADLGYLLDGVGLLLVTSLPLPTGQRRMASRKSFVENALPNRKIWPNDRRLARDTAQ